MEFGENDNKIVQTLPELSKPWDSSWPTTVPIPPKLITLKAIKWKKKKKKKKNKWTEVFFHSCRTSGFKSNPTRFDRLSLVDLWASSIGEAEKIIITNTRNVQVFRRCRYLHYCSFWIHENCKMLCMALSITVTILIEVGIEKLSLFLEQKSKVKKISVQ